MWAGDQPGSLGPLWPGMASLGGTELGVLRYGLTPVPGKTDGFWAGVQLGNCWFRAGDQPGDLGSRLVTSLERLTLSGIGLAWQTAGSALVTSLCISVPGW